MKKASFLIVFSIFFFSLIIVVILFLYASEKPNHQHASFLRKFILDPIQISEVLDVQYNSYYVAGVTKNHIYFGNISGARHLLVSNSSLTDTQHVEMSIEGIDKLEFRRIRVKVDSPYFYISDGTTPAIFRGSLGSWRADRFMYDSAHFMQSIPINSKSYVIRTTSRTTNSTALGKVTNTPPYVKLAHDLLEKQVDGKFCVDGMMHFNKDMNWLVYVYYYRNQFICADSSLNLLYRGNTIDTVSKAKIKLAEIKSENSITVAAPPMMVNKKSCVSGNNLFVNSNLLAKNEDKKKFESSSVIDVYNLKDGKYQYSFYLPKYNKRKLREFQVLGDTLIALYDHYVLKYQLNPKYFI